MRLLRLTGGVTAGLAAWLGVVTTGPQQLPDLVLHGGRMAMPGLHDPHIHLLEGGLYLDVCFMAPNRAQVTYERRMRECARGPYAGEPWVRAGGGGDRRVVDGPARRHAAPRSGHGSVDRRPARLRARARLRRHAPTPANLERAYAGLLAGMRRASRRGVTSVSDAGGYRTRGHDTVWLRAESAGTMTVRASNARYVYPNRPVKAQIRALRERFRGDSDGAARRALDALAADRARAGLASDVRHRLTHAYLVDADDRPRLAKLGVIADLQLSASTLATSYTAFLEGQIGAERAAELIPLASLVEAGATVVLTSDWDADPLAPFAALERGLTRPREGIADLAAGLRMLTIDAAYLLRHQEPVGSLEVGKLADVIVLDRNLFDVDVGAISDTEVLLTLLGGVEVHRADGF